MISVNSSRHPARAATFEHACRGGVLAVGQHRVPERGHTLAGRGDCVRRSAGASRRPRPPTGRASARGRAGVSSAPGAVGLVDDEHVGDLHQTGLVRLHAVAPARVDDDDGRVGRAGHLDLDLADADGLDERPTSKPTASSSRTASGVASARPPRWPRVAIERMNTPASRAWSLHPHPVAEDRPAGERRRRVDGEHGDARRRRPERARRRRSVSVDLPAPGAPVRPTV